ncbi:MAG: SGNH/GDSL hydrolase family protein [Candidatus Pacebacteria bacterium]|jgi:hypothetical protein|nr:SGNH/GDSL hydrolase family protein [Candidatus Paceibacterota bacterium]
MNKVIHCLGDSHTSFFSGSNTIQPLWPKESNDRIPIFKTYRIDASLAYNLCKTGTTTYGREKLFNILEKIKKNDIILLSFGEVDCRVHLIKQASLQNKPLKEIAKECVERYFSVIKEITSLGYTVIIWGAIPTSTSETPINKDYPSFGSCFERNHATKLFNEYLSELARKNNIFFLSFFDDLTKNDGLTKRNCLADKTHLSQRIMPLVVKKIRVLLPEMNIVLFKNTILGKLPWKVQYTLFSIVWNFQDILFSLSRKRKDLVFVLKQFIKKLIKK